MGFFSDAFSRDGYVARITEKVPVVGFVTAGVQAVSGNKEQAARALAQCGMSTAGAATGFLVGGPIGAVLGGAGTATAVTVVDVMQS
ncbi:hypothetical protein CVT26_015176 [Gymnopilus dilepis]|uniref:Uncharacterized protein n=1 Tax=Gymnopilus dilepis TaxID=231916 RepID=A0A409WA00_9AGAR|nr:hypothetical protein CVT26_015176 [Gymnopilus dilepis]